MQVTTVVIAKGTVYRNEAALALYIDISHLFACYKHAGFFSPKFINTVGFPLPLEDYPHPDFTIELEEANYCISRLIIPGRMSRLNNNSLSNK